MEPNDEETWISRPSGKTNRMEREMTAETANDLFITDALRAAGCLWNFRHMHIWCSFI